VQAGGGGTCGWWREGAGRRGGTRERVGTRAGTEAHGAESADARRCVAPSRRRVVVVSSSCRRRVVIVLSSSCRRAVAPSRRRTVVSPVVSPLRCVGAWTGACGRVVALSRCVGVGAWAYAWADAGARVGGGRGAWMGTGARMPILAPRAATLRVAAWAWAWARRGRACAPVGPSCFRRPPACVSGWHWGVGPAYRNVSTKKEKNDSLSRVRGHPACAPSRHPCTVRPCTPASLLQRTCARRVALARRASALVRRSRHRRAARAPVVSPTRSMRLWGLQGKCSAPKKKRKKYSPEPKVWQVGRGGFGACKVQVRVRKTVNKENKAKSII